ncbi:MAG TPA: hypothetical protein VG448_11530 [Solirubrobacterales bacterium]|nr:hypothetical protein [Solirubrobacterales bacterium]
MTPLLVRILFIHHSVGRYLIRDGAIRERLAAIAAGGPPLLELWDHDYNKRGLSDGSGRSLGRAFPLPDDDTDPRALLKLFTSEDPDVRSAREQVLDFDLIAMKSCYPNSAIGSDVEMARDQEVYRRLLGSLAALPRNQFLLLTSPPLVPLRSRRAEGRRARYLAHWLSKEVELPPNVAVFDLFNRLAAPDGPHADRLRRRYRRRLPIDAHPNVRAGEEVAPDLVESFVRSAARARKRPIDARG